LRIVRTDTNFITSEHDSVFPLFYGSTFLTQKINEGFEVRVIDFFQGDNIIGRFVYDDKSKISLPAASFGGLYVNNEGMSFVKEMLLELGQLELGKIVFAPDIYGFCSVIDPINGYRVIEDVTDFLPLDGTYYSKLERSERKRYNKCKRHGFYCEDLTIADLPKIHSMILETKNRKGYPGTMSFARLEEMFKLFPREFRSFGCFDGDNLIAVMINIKISEDIFYNFYLGDKFEYRSYSPIVFLLGRVYDYAQLQGGRILDLGLSSDKGKLNEGLHSFKLKLGGKSSNKITFIKD